MIRIAISAYQNPDSHSTRSWSRGTDFSLELRHYASTTINLRLLQFVGWPTRVPIAVSWVIADLVGKGGHVRTIPVPDWVKTGIDAWTELPGL